MEITMTDNRFRENLNHEENDIEKTYNENHRTKSSKNSESISHENTDEYISDVKTNDKSQLELQKVAEKVGEVSGLQTDNHLDNCPPQSILLEETCDPEVIVRDLESRHLPRLGKNKLPQQVRHMLVLAAHIHISKWRGIMVTDLTASGKKKDYSEKILQYGRKCGLLVPSENRIGKQKQYFLSNYKYIIDGKQRSNKREEIPPNDILLLLARELASQQNQYHGIGLSSNLVNIKDYEQIKWPIPSNKNKQKVIAFNFTSRRSCTFTLSPTGTVKMYITSTVDSFKLHSYYGLIDFFSCCGKIDLIFALKSRRGFNSIPNISEWYLRRFDCNKDLNIQPLSEKYPEIHWTSRGLLQLKHLGVIFQGYCKGMPDVGDCLRLEHIYKIKDNSKVADVVSQLNNETFPFYTAEDLFNDKRKIKQD